MEIIKVIRDMVFFNQLGKFDPYLKKVETFNLLKNLISRCVTGEMVDTELLLKLIHQVRLRKEMTITTREEESIDTEGISTLIM